MTLRTQALAARFHRRIGTQLKEYAMSDPQRTGEARVIIDDELTRSLREEGDGSTGVMRLRRVIARLEGYTRIELEGEGGRKRLCIMVDKEQWDRFEAWEASRSSGGGEK